jgi:hypothetical protein
MGASWSRVCILPHNRRCFLIGGTHRSFAEGRDDEIAHDSSQEKMRARLEIYPRE